MKELKLKDIKLDKSFNEIEAERFNVRLKKGLPSVKTWSLNEDKFRKETRRVHLKEDASIPLDMKKLTEADRDYLKIGNKIYPNTSEDFGNASINAVLDRTKKSYEQEQKEKAEEARKAELTAKAKDLLKKIDEDPEKEKGMIHALFNHLVPASGKAETTAGELVRAMMRLLYRDFNDGDVFYDGYGKETCASDAAYICETLPELKNSFFEIAKNELDEKEYTKALETISNKLVDILMKDKTWLFAEENTVDSRLDYDQDYFDYYVPTYDYDFDLSGDLETYLEYEKIDDSDIYDFLEGLAVDANLPRDCIRQQYSNAWIAEDLTRSQYEDLEAAFPKAFNWWLKDLENQYGSPWEIESEEEEDLEESKLKETKLTERNWRHKVPMNIAKKFALAIQKEEPPYGDTKKALLDILNWVKKTVGEDDFYEDSLIEDVEWADFEDEDEVNYYINEMYDTLDGYSVWMEPASTFQESKLKESTWTVEIYDPKTNKTIEKKSGFGSDRAACEYGDHTLEDLEEQGIEADYDTFEESKARKGRFKEYRGMYAKLFKKFLDGVGFDKTGPFAEKDTPYSERGFEWESQTSKLTCSFNPETKFWGVKWIDYDDPEYGIKKNGRGFNNLIDFLFDLPGSIMAQYSDDEPAWYYEEYVDFDESKRPVSFEDLYTRFMQAAMDWEDDGPSNPRIQKFAKEVITACKLKDDERLKQIVYEYNDIQDAVGPLYLDLILHLNGEELDETCKMKEAEEEWREIPLRDETVARVVDNVLGQMSDGYWENSTAMEKYWRAARIGKNNTLKINKKQSIPRGGYKNKWGGPLYIENKFHGKTDEEIKKIFAQKVKYLVKEEGLEWSRDNEEKPSWFRDLTVADIYSAYDWLMGRKEKKMKESTHFAPERIKSILEELIRNTNRLFRSEIKSVDLNTRVEGSIVYVEEKTFFTDSDWPTYRTIEYDAETDEWNWEAWTEYPEDYDGHNGVPYQADGEGVGFGKLLESLADELGLRGVEKYITLDSDYHGKYRKDEQLLLNHKEDLDHFIGHETTLNAHPFRGSYLYASGYRDHTHYGYHANMDDGKVRLQIIEHHPYDDADYTWALCEDFVNHPEQWKFIKARKVINKKDLAGIKEVQEVLKEENSKVSPRMIHN